MKNQRSKMVLAVLVLVLAFASVSSFDRSRSGIADCGLRIADLGHSELLIEDAMRMSEKSRVANLGNPNSELQQVELRNPNAEIRTPSSEHQTPNSELRTPNSESCNRISCLIRIQNLESTISDRVGKTQTAGALAPAVLS